MSDLEKPVPAEVDIYKFLLSRYTSNESGAEDLGFTMSRDLVISEVLRGLGLEVTRHACTLTMKNTLKFMHLNALTINGVFIGVEGVGGGWDDLITRNATYGALMEDSCLRKVSDYDALQDQERILRTEEPYLGRLQQWVDAEVSFMQALLLNTQTHVVSIASSLPRL